MPGAARLSRYQVTGLMLVFVALVATVPLSVIVVESAPPAVAVLAIALAVWVGIASLFSP